EGHVSVDQTIRFYTKSGLLIAQRQGEWIQLDFPVIPSEVISTPEGLSQALGVAIKWVGKNSLGYLVEVESEELVKQMQPNFQLMKTLPMSAVIVTSWADSDSEYDFVSRFFAPRLGIDEDPVTGSAHCCLAPFWRERNNKDEFLAYQASSRGGVVKVNYTGSGRVFLSGQAVTILRSELVI
ncbi:MAG: PhzF family phenazine biosynthesis protein, partial [Moorea sp. SIO3C2]|nr:PhzF family phenazine biosynthesis protein [Moorena sp. SIO3C2]